MATTAAPVHAPAHTRNGPWSWITTVDHKRIGVMYGITAFVFFLVGGLEAVAIRIQLMKPENDFISPDFYNQMFTMHGTTMIFLAVMPLSAAFFNFLIPLMIGARDVAFPRLNAFSLLDLPVRRDLPEPARSSSAARPTPAGSATRT